MESLNDSNLEFNNLKTIKLMPIIEGLLEEILELGFEINFSVLDTGRLYAPKGNMKKIQYRYVISKNGVKIKSTDDSTISSYTCNLNEFVRLALDNKYVFNELWKALMKINESYKLTGKYIGNLVRSF